MEDSVRKLLGALTTYDKAGGLGSTVEALYSGNQVGREIARLGYVDAIGGEIARIQRERDIYESSNPFSTLLLGVPQSTVTALQEALGFSLPNDPYLSKLADQLHANSTIVENAWRDAGLNSLQDQLRHALESQYTPSVISQAEQLARTLDALKFPTSLESFRPASDLLTAQILGLETFGIPSREAIAALGITTSFAGLLDSVDQVTSQVFSGTRSLLDQEVPYFPSVAAYGKFLDVAGLSLLRLPRPRPLSFRERRQRLRAHVASNHPPPHVTKAKTLVHKYELTLRQIIDECMSLEYGEDWAETRLMACDCKDLLGKWRAKANTNPLDHADFHHYVQIMTHSEHFSRIFELGFENPEELEILLRQAGQLRARSHHANNFTTEDLRLMRVTWRTIEKGLLAFEPKFEIEMAPA